MDYHTARDRIVKSIFADSKGDPLYFVVLFNHATKVGVPDDEQHTIYRRMMAEGFVKERGTGSLCSLTNRGVALAESLG